MVVSGKSPGRPSLQLGFYTEPAGMESIFGAKAISIVCREPIHNGKALTEGHR